MDTQRALKSVIALGTLMSALLLGGCATHHNAPAKNVSLENTAFSTDYSVRFSPEDWPEALYGDLYLPKGVTLRPVVLMVHGGGWERRSRGDMSWIAEELASHGFAVFNVDYRFAPEYTFPAQLHDLQIARTWLNRHADQYQLDASRVYGFGFSSGAHLIALLALVSSSGDAEALNQPYGGSDTVLRAVVAGGTPADLTTFGSGKLLRQFLGGAQPDIPDTYRTASPITHVTGDAPPFFLFHGNMDSLVPFRQAKTLHQTLLASGVESELYEMRLRGHVTSFLTAGSAVSEASGFLKRHSNRR
ncbi:alpha/beta fold hydrolase [Marinobacter sp.]|uniref:alpha/beta fold hydrolase n=1 Tax=Marinobacter sp. TaxID=50741 RepID=UPI003A93481B